MTLPLGYRYAATYAGIRKQQRNDIALIVSDHLANAAAVFTKNVVQAAPVRLAKRHLSQSSGKAAAVLVNAGNANCANRTGDKTALLSCKALAKAIGCKPHHVLPASTGVIGVELDPVLLTRPVPELVESLDADRFMAAADAILTTDTRVKVCCREVQFRRGPVRIAGMTKGSGMIQPNMATTLGFVMTDAAIASRHLSSMLNRAIESSYNSLTVDGDTSTNDMVAVLANGASKQSPDTKDRLQFERTLEEVMQDLARQIAADGEGATKLITVSVKGFKSVIEARRVARTIANSPLVKTAMAGNDPNWGRILSAAGYSGVNFDPSKIDVHLQSELVCHKGLATVMNEEALKKKLNTTGIEIGLTLRGSGKGEARFFTCDFTEGYIRINGSYRT